MATKEQRKRYGAKYYAANKEIILAKSRAQYHANRDRELARSKAFHAAHPEQARIRSRRRYYGLDPHVYDQIYESQHGLCAICGEPPPLRRILHVDHDHRTGEVRGLLCHGCNWALGALGDTLEGVERAAAYLRGALTSLAA